MIIVEVLNGIAMGVLNQVLMHSLAIFLCTAGGSLCLCACLVGKS